MPGPDELLGEIPYAPKHLLDPSLATHEAVDFALLADVRDNEPLTYTDLDIREIDGRIHFRFLGGLVDTWAGDAMSAQETIETGLTLDGASARSDDLLNRESFTAKGSTAAIRLALHSCE